MPKSKDENKGSIISELLTWQNYFLKLQNITKKIPQTKDVAFFGYTPNCAF